VGTSKRERFHGPIPIKSTGRVRKHEIYVLTLTLSKYYKCHLSVQKEVNQKTKFLCKFMAYIRTKFHLSSFTSSLIITTGS